MHQMSNQRRNLFFKVLENEALNNNLLLRMFFLDDHFPPDKLDKALGWLIFNGVVGRKFEKWFKEECKASDLEMHRLLLSAVDNEKLSPVVMGKNFK